MNCQQIKTKVSIRSVLEYFKMFPIKKNGNTAFYFALDREEKIPSLSVDYHKNVAFDFGTGRSYDVISIVQILNRCDVSEAIQFLKKSDFIISESNKEILPCRKTNYEILLLCNIKHPALVQYLKKRSVFEQNHFVKEVHYVIGDKKYFGIGFENNSGGFEIRNQYSKICLGKKDVTFIGNHLQSKKEILLFEGFFDFLTYKMIMKDELFLNDVIILNSTTMLFKVRNMLSRYEKISLFLDNDISGKSVKNLISTHYKNVEDCSVIYKDFKDLNEWHCDQCSQTVL